MSQLDVPFAEFLGMIRDKGIQVPADADPLDRLDDYGIDSLGKTQLVVAMEDSGARVSAHLLLTIETVGDAHHVFVVSLPQD